MLLWSIIKFKGEYCELSNKIQLSIQSFIANNYEYLLEENFNLEKYMSFFELPLDQRKDFNLENYIKYLRNSDNAESKK